MVPVAGDEAVAVKLPVPSPSRIVTVLVLKLTTARSSFPSPLKSPTATEFGFLPVAGDEVRAKLPVPSPSKMLTAPRPSEQYE